MTAQETALLAAARRRYQERDIDQAEQIGQNLLADNPEHAAALYLLGIIARDRGDHARARRLLTAAIASDSEQPDCHNALGNVLFALNLFPEAAQACERALVLKPDFPEAHNNLGNARMALGHPEWAIASYQAALALRPDYGHPLNNMGNALFVLGRNEEALDSQRRALALLPGSVAVLGSLGNVLQKLGRFAEAIDHYEKAIALDPGHAPSYSNLGAALHSLKRHAQAVECCRKAIALMPGSAEAHINLGNALEALGRFDDAMASYDRALVLQPGNAEIYGNMGNALIENGHLDRARRAFEQAIALAPDRPKFHLYLTEVVGVQPESPTFAALVRLEGRAASMTEEDRIDLHFALGKAHADMGRHDESFRHLVAGNTIKRQRASYDETAVLGQMDLLRAAFPARTIAAWQGVGAPSPLPIFILGMPRSGSTLVEQILASHPAVFAGGELPPFEDTLLQTITPMSGVFPLPGSVARHSGLPRRIAERYLSDLRALAPSAERIVDKMPGNFKFIGHINLALPGAHIIHIRRDPIDTCLSCYSKLFTSGLAFSYDLGELGRYYRAYERLMRHWTDVMPPGAILELRYEDLLNDFVAQCRRILAHCGLDWDARCLAFHEVSRPIRTASATQVRQPLFQTSVGRARHYRPELLRPLLDALEGDN